jgi:hypothetical protein
MTSPPREVEVCCPNCSSVYRDWYRPSLNLDLDDFDDDYIDAASSAVCPSCGHKIYFDSLVVIDNVFFTDDGQSPDASVRGV